MEVSPTWNFAYYLRVWAPALWLGKTHSSWADCQLGISYMFLRVWAQLLWLCKGHASWAVCRNIQRNLASFNHLYLSVLYFRGRLLIRSSYLSASSHLYLCIWTLSGKLRIGSSIQLGILYMFLCYELEHYDIGSSGQLGTLLINRCVNLPERTKLLERTYILQEQVFNLSQGYLACVFYIEWQYK